MEPQRGVVIAITIGARFAAKLVGVGEGIEDLQPSNVDDFVAIFN